MKKLTKHIGPIVEILGDDLQTVTPDTTSVENINTKCYVFKIEEYFILEGSKVEALAAYTTKNHVDWSLDLENSSIVIKIF